MANNPAPVTTDVFGIPVSAMCLGRTVDHVTRKIDRETPCRVIAFNTNKLWQIQTEPLLRRSVSKAHLVLPDGLSIVLASHLVSDVPVPERVTGVDLFFSVVKRCAERGFQPYFLGARPGVLKKMVQRFRKTYPSLDIAGFHHGYFDDDERSRIRESINASGADVLFIGISSPLKEELMEYFGTELDVPVVMGVGGSFDVAAGVTDRAPEWMRTTGLEWFFRFLQEPARLGGRYLQSHLYFVWRFLNEIIEEHVCSRVHRFSNQDG